MEGIENAKASSAGDLGALLDAGDDAVVTLVAGPTRLVAHRAVLVHRSSVFAQMFRHDTPESRSRQLTLEDVEGPVLRQLLSHLYTLQAPQLPGMASQLLVAATTYGVASLKPVISGEKPSTMEGSENAKETTAVDLGALLDACDDAVVTLVAGDTGLVAHRAVLMDRSPVFAAMFRHDTLESRSGQVTIEDVEGPVLRQLLSHLYTLRAPQLPGMASQLLAAANKYGVDSLKAACEQQVAAQLSVETAAAIAVMAVRYNCQSLTHASIAFLMDHMYKVMATRGWAEALHSQPDDVIEVKKLLVAKMRSLPAFEKGRRLREATAEGSVGELEVLLAAGVDGVARFEYSWSSLHVAAAHGQVEAARRLVAQGLPVDARDWGQWTPLHWAAVCGHAAVVRLLLAASADHSARTVRGRTPLHWAAASGHAEVAAALLATGADRAATDDEGKTPLDVARQQNHHQLVDLLAER